MMLQVLHLKAKGITSQLQHVLHLLLYIHDGSWGLLKLFSVHYLFKSPEGTISDFCLVIGSIWLLSGSQVISGLDCLIDSFILTVVFNWLL